MRKLLRVARVPGLLAVFAAALAVAMVRGDIGWPVLPKPVVTVAGATGDIGWPAP